VSGGSWRCKRDPPPETGSVGHRRDVQGGALWASSAAGSGRWGKSACCAREFGISRKLVRKMVSFTAPPGHRREQPATRPKLDGFVGVIDAIVEEDKTRPAKQRHTAKRVWERLREEHQFTGDYTDAFNAHLEAECRKRSKRTLRGHTETLTIHATCCAWPSSSCSTANVAPPNAA